MGEPIFSIIVPVYKVEKYLMKCLESITEQTYNDYEIILVDDGSPDRCPAICDEFKDKEPRCKVIHQPNKGLSGARNAGLKAAKGKYVYFLDSDDSIANSLLEELQEIFSKRDVDLIGFNATVYEMDSTIILSTGNWTDEIKKGVEIAQKRVPLSTVPLYCYRRDFLQREQLQFKEGIYYEDILFTAQVFLKNPKVYYMDKNLYFYNKREASITTSEVKLKNYFDLIGICICLIDSESEEQREKYKAAYRNIIKSYLLLSEEVYRMMKMKDRKMGTAKRNELMERVRCRKGNLGLTNYAIASFPGFFYIIREVRRKFRWQKQKLNSN